jgi:hypothetical protein
MGVTDAQWLVIDIRIRWRGVDRREGTASELESAFDQCACCGEVAPIGETVNTPAKERNAFTPSHLNALIVRGRQPKLIVYFDVALHIKPRAIVNRVGKRTAKALKTPLQPRPTMDHPAEFGRI